MVLRMKTLIFWRFTERSNFKGGGKANIVGGLPKKGGGRAWTVCQFEGGLGKKSRLTDEFTRGGR